MTTLEAVELFLTNYVPSEFHTEARAMLRLLLEMADTRARAQEIIRQIVAGSEQP